MYLFPEGRANPWTRRAFDCDDLASEDGKMKAYDMGELYGEHIWFPSRSVPSVEKGDTLLLINGETRQIIKVYRLLWWVRVTYQFEAVAKRNG